MSGAAVIIAGVGFILSATGMGINFAGAAAARRRQADAEYDAQQALKRARKKLNVNFYENLSINKEAYELEREALLSAGAQATAAGAESERGAAAVAGRVLAAQNQAQAQQRVAMSKEQNKLDLLVQTEESRLRDVGVQLDLEEVAGAQVAAGRAETQAAQMQAAGVQGALDTAKAGAGLGGAIGEAKAAAGGDFAGIAKYSDGKEGLFRQNDAPGTLDTQLAGFAATPEAIDLGLDADAFTKSLSIEKRPAIDERPFLDDAKLVKNPNFGQSQIQGTDAMQEDLLRQLGPQGLQAFKKYLKQQSKLTLDTSGVAQ
tara:strand:+ start:11900 stop:12847 length:948 start_codon:yes stop_codon:yes gene_type:complete